MIRRLMGMMTVAAAGLLASCGGGGSDTGDCVFDCGGNGGGTTTVADLIVTLDKQSLTNSGSDELVATVLAVDSSRVVVSGATVTLSVDEDAVLVAGSTTTDTAGKVTATVGVGADRSNRLITFTAVSGSLRRTATIAVTGSSIGASLATTVAPGSVGNVIRYRVIDVNSNPLVGQAITVSAPGLTGATGVTGSNGDYEFVYTAPSTAGQLVITAVAAGVSDTQNIAVLDATSNVPVAVGPVTSASVSANPKTVAVNTAGSTTNQTQIRALFQGAANKAIANVRVRFDLAGDPNSVGGTIASGNSKLYSTANGEVTTAYIPGTRASPTDGVTVRACWDYGDAALDRGECPNSVTVKITVTSEPISVSLGTNELIEDGDLDLTYIKQFVVMVVDSAGVAQEGVTISPVLDLTDYVKGRWVPGTSSWVRVVTQTCANEDINRNGVLDTGEDLNLNKVLDPRKADVSVRLVDGAKTDSSGLAVLQIEFPKNVASWVKYKLTVSATGISGTEGVASFAGVLPVPAAAVNSLTASPAFQTSPYGESSSCTDPN
jgi:hypothetical protein